MAECNYQHCLVCNSKQTKVILITRDFTVSKKEYGIVQCTNCGFAFTQNHPDKDHIGPYYKSNDYVSHNDTQQGLFFKVYHLVRKIMLRKKLGMVKKYTQLTQGSALDIGCGTGYFLNTLQEAKWEVDGLEQDSEARAIAQKKFYLNIQDPNELHHLPNEKYDCITLWHVLEHVHDLHTYLSKIHQLLKADGVVMIAVPNHDSLDAKYYGKHWAAWDVPIHLWHFNPKSMAQLMAQHQFKIIKKKPLVFDAFYVSLLSEKHQKGNAFRGMIIGTLSLINSLFNTNKSSSITYIIKKK